jgi:hypothetical protein
MSGARCLHLCPSSGHSASTVGGLVYIAGAGVDSRRHLSFDPASGAWSELASTRFGRKYGSAFMMGACVYIVSGLPAPTRIVKCYDVATNMWMLATHIIEARYACCAVTIRSSGQADEQDLRSSPRPPVIFRKLLL